MSESPTIRPEPGHTTESSPKASTEGSKNSIQYAATFPQPKMNDYTATPKGTLACGWSDL
jgi:hypothetical protein